MKEGKILFTISLEIQNTFYTYLSRLNQAYELNLEIEKKIQNNEVQQKIFPFGTHIDFHSFEQQISNLKISAFDSSIKHLYKLYNHIIRPVYERSITPLDISIAIPPTDYLKFQLSNAKILSLKAKWSIDADTDIYTVLFPYFRHELLSVLLSVDEQTALSKILYNELDKFKTYQESKNLLPQ